MKTDFTDVAMIGTGTGQTLIRTAHTHPVSVVVTTNTFPTSRLHAALVILTHRATNTHIFTFQTTPLHVDKPSCTSPTHSRGLTQLTVQSQARQAHSFETIMTEIVIILAGQAVTRLIHTTSAGLEAQLTFTSSDTVEHVVG